MQKFLSKSQDVANQNVSVSCLFMHTLDGSLGSFVRVRELSVSLAKLGANIQILTPYENDKVLAPGVQITSIPNLALSTGLSSMIYQISRRGYYNKFIQNLLYKKHANWIFKKLSDKMIKIVQNNKTRILQAEQDFSLSPCVKVKQATGLPLVADIHNITAEELVAAGIIERDGKEFRDIQHKTASLLSVVDRIIVVSALMKNYVKSQYNIPDGKITIVPPGGRPRLNHLPKKSMQPNIVYSGLVSYRENLDLFVRSMPIIKNRHADAKFFITKKGESLTHIAQLASKLGITPQYFWFDESANFYDFLSSCHVGILPSSYDLARGMGTPVKLFDYMSVGLPVVANDIGGWTELISKYKLGVLTRNEPASFADGVDDVINNNTEYSQNALRLVNTIYNWDTSARKLLETYKGLL